MSSHSSRKYFKAHDKWVRLATIGDYFDDNCLKVFVYWKLKLSRSFSNGLVKIYTSAQMRIIIVFTALLGWGTTRKDISTEFSSVSSCP